MKKYFYLSLLCVATVTYHTSVLAERQVSVKSFAELALSRTLQYPASVVNLQVADIAAETSGRIIQFSLQVGDVVEKGQVLLEIDCTTAGIDQDRAEASLKRLQATRKLTQQQLDRARRLLKSRSISREELDQRQTQLSADNASIEEQKASLAAVVHLVNHCQVKAPYSGTVIEKLSNAGAYASPGAPMLRLLKRHEVEIKVDLPVEIVSRLQQAKRINFIAHKKAYPVKIRSILPMVNSQSLQQPIRLSIITEDRPPGGSFGLLAFETGNIFLPARYVQKRDGVFGVFIARNQQAIFKPLPDAEEGQSVLCDLAADELIIIDHLQLINRQDDIAISL